MDSDSSISDENNGDIVSKEIREAAKEVSLDLLPKKSKMLYTAAYNSFRKWRKEHGTNSFCEDVLLAYFAEQSKKLSPASLWPIFSMLKTTINAYDNVKIGTYKKLTGYLKKLNKGYQSKKSEVFTKDNISKFLTQAPDEIYLCEKVALIFGITGALRRVEFTNICMEDVSKFEDEETLLVKIRDTKNDVPRSFTITGTLFSICKKYMDLRPVPCSLDRFFLRYANGKCNLQPVGINKFASMPKDIATYLKLPNVKSYTGHSFRRTSATLLVDAGADIMTLQRHGGWKSSTVAMGYVADSITSKKNICNQITSGLNIPSTSKSDAPAHSNTPPKPTTRTDESEEANLNTRTDQSQQPKPRHSTPQTSHRSPKLRVSRPQTSHRSPKLRVSRPQTSQQSPQLYEDTPRHSTPQQPISSQQSPQLYAPRNVPADLFSVSYHPDLGLCIENSNEDRLKTFTFHNCNVTINYMQDSTNVSCKRTAEKSVKTNDLN